MEIPAIHPHLEAADIDPERLVANKQLSEEQKLGEVARQFEALLLRQILQNTQKTVISSEFADNSTAASIYQDLVGHQLADSISKSGSVGLAKMLQQQLHHQLHPASTAGHDPASKAQPTSFFGVGVARPFDFSITKPPALKLQQPAPAATALRPHE